MSPAHSSEPNEILPRTGRGIRAVAALAGVLLAVSAGFLAFNRLGNSVVSLSYDLPFVVHRAGGGNDLRIVYLDKLDAEALDRKPQAQILDQLGEAGARAVLYDIIFDRESEDPATDLEFAAAIRRFRGVDGDGKPMAGSRQRPVLLACGRRTFTAAGMPGEQLIPPVDVLLDASDGFGLVAFDDDTFQIRKLSAGSPDEPSLVWKAAGMLGEGLDKEQRLQPRWINFCGPPPDRTAPGAATAIQSCPARSILSGDVKPEFFRDKIVIIGGEPGIFGEALGKDLFSTPFHRLRTGRKLPLMSGAEVQANALANLLQGNWLDRSGPAFDRMLVILTGILAGAGFTFLRPLAGIVCAAALVAAFALAGVCAMHFGQVWFPWSVPAFVQLPVALVWGIAAHSYIERTSRMELAAERQSLRAALARYLSPQMLDRLSAEGFKADLGGEEMQAALMLTDLENFTTMCERVGNPRRVIETLNDYFERTTGSIFETDGIVIQFVGDSIFPAWGAPGADPEAPVKAARAAWKLFNRDKLFVEGVELRTRIGLHFDTVMAGNVGSSRHVNFAIIGDAVNLTSRLEGLNRMLGTHILMSGALRDKLGGEFRTRRVGSFRVKGREDVTAVFELLGPVVEAREPGWISRYHEALDALASGETETARRLFRTVDTSRGAGGDGPSRFFLGLLDSDKDIPDGIVELKEK